MYIRNHDMNIHSEAFRVHINNNRSIYINKYQHESGLRVGYIFTEIGLALPFVKLFSRIFKQRNLLLGLPAVHPDLKSVIVNMEVVDTFLYRIFLNGQYVETSNKQYYSFYKWFSVLYTIVFGCVG